LTLQDIDLLLKPYLSLSPQTRSFTYAPSGQGNLTKLQSAHDFRLPFNVPFPIELLVIDLTLQSTGVRSLSSLLSSFNPLHCILEGPKKSGLGYFSSINLDGSRDWDRLNTLRFNRVQPTCDLVDLGFIYERSPWAKGLDLVYELFPLESNLGGVLEQLKDELGDEDLRGKVGKVEIWVEDEEAVNVAKEILVGKIKAKTLEIGYRKVCSSLLS